MSARDIEIQIEQLILEGLDSRQHVLITEAMRHELERLIAEGGVPAHWQDGGALTARPIEVRANQEPARIGESIAQAIYQGAMS